MPSNTSKKFSRLGRLALQNLSRNMLLSIATIVMMGLIIFIFNVIMVLNVLAQSSLVQLGDKVDLILYINDDATSYEITEMTAEVESLPVVKSVSYTNKEEALAEFISLYPDKSDPFTVYGIENPLPSNLQIVTQSPDQHGIVIDYLENSAYGTFLLDVESSNENQEIVARLLSVTNFTKQLIIGVTVTFVFGSLLMIMNAIHLSIFTRKKEISIMQLVGANPSMIRFPFLFEGAFYSLFAVIFSFILLIFFLEGTNLNQFSGFQEGFQPALLFGLELAASLAIGVISSFIAISYYLHESN